MESPMFNQSGIQQVYTLNIHNVLCRKEMWMWRFVCLVWEWSFGKHTKL